MKRCITRPLGQNREPIKKTPQIRTHTSIIDMAGQINGERRIHSEKIKISHHTHIKSRWNINLNTKEVITKFIINQMNILMTSENKIFLKQDPQNTKR